VITEIDQGSEYVSHRDPVWSKFVCSLHKFRLDMPATEFQRFREFWLRYDALKKPYLLDASVARFEMAADMAGLSAKQLYRFVDYATSMEALLLEGGTELCFKLAIRMAVLLVGKPDHHQNVYEFMREAYEFRSALVHGSEPPLIKVKRGESEVRIDLEEAFGA
jgi:hypothetical protein